MLVAKQLGKYTRIYFIFALLHMCYLFFIFFLMIYALMMLENIFVHMFM